jgi:ketosteroid isomerase-like protein
VTKFPFQAGTRTALPPTRRRWREYRGDSRDARQFYAAYAAEDTATIDTLISVDCVMHVSGQHPLPGDDEGKDAIWGYFDKVVQRRVDLVAVGVAQR